MASESRAPAAAGDIGPFRSVGAKVTLGFGAVLAILAIVSGIGFWSLVEVDAGIVDYRAHNREAALAQSIDVAFRDYRGLVREHLLADNEGAAAKAAWSLHARSCVFARRIAASPIPMIAGTALRKSSKLFVKEYITLMVSN